MHKNTARSGAPSGDSDEIEIERTARSSIYSVKSFSRLAQDLSDRRSPERQALIRHLYDAGPRPNGRLIDEVLAAFARRPVSIYRAIVADELPIDRRFQ